VVVVVVVVDELVRLLLLLPQAFCLVVDASTLDSAPPLMLLST
jgi:hypothetical protein